MLNIKKLLMILTICSAMSVSLPAFAEQKESVYDRVMRTQTLRCGYIVWGDQLQKDPNTGKMSGMTYDMVNAIGKELGLTIEWTEETGWGTFPEGLNANRFDVMCTSVWASGDRAKAALLTKPMAYNAMYAFVRADDSRFDTLDKMNSADASIAVVDGDPTKATRESRFPKAKKVDLSAAVDMGDYLLTVVTKKADILLGDSAVVAKYNKTAEQKLKFAAGGVPVRINASVFAVKNGEDHLKYLIDQALDIIMTTGEGAQIVAPYSPAFLPVAPNYDLNALKE